MTQNRIQQLLRDPTLEQPALDYYEVRLPWQSFAVRREVAERVMEATRGLERDEWVRIETVGGSVAWVRTEHVVFVREWSSAQRESERRFWAQIDSEYEKRSSSESEGSESRETSSGEEPDDVDEPEGWEPVEVQYESDGPSIGQLVIFLWIVLIALALLRANMAP